MEGHLEHRAEDER
ncbi:hypothetical protein LEMLEM_LOCUS18015 [Lemmus lemmus]